MSSDLDHILRVVRILIPLENFRLTLFLALIKPSSFLTKSVTECRANAKHFGVMLIHEGNGFTTERGKKSSISYDRSLLRLPP